VREYGVDPDDEAIVARYISMAHNRIAPWCEGVEIEEHLDFLRTEVAKELQGYLFAVPAAASLRICWLNALAYIHGTQSTDNTLIARPEQLWSD